MAATRPCPSCGRSSGPKLSRCMYCGASLPAEDDDEPVSAETTEQAARERAGRAKELLAQLKPEARALLPADVLRKLEADAPGGPSAPRDVPAPRRQVDPRVEERLDELPFTSVAELPAAMEPRSAPPEPTRNAAEAEGFEAALSALLARGGGPFGPRKSTWRLILLPDAAYRSGLPWLRPRLAATAHIDPYTATLHLQRPAPSFLMAAEARSQLAPAFSDLGKAGLHVALLERGRWTRGRVPHVVEDIGDLDAAQLLLTLEGGETLVLPRSGLFGAYFAEVGPRPDVAVPKAARNRWGLPTAPDRPALTDRFTPYFVLDLLRRDDPRPLRIRSSNFDFTRLGTGRGISAAMNMRELARRLGPSPEGLPVDEGFRRITSLPGADEAEDPQPGGANRALSRREADFTEYVLLRGVRHHPLR